MFLSTVFFHDRVKKPWKPEACFNTVMEEAVTASLDSEEEEEGDDGWVNFIFDPKENRTQCKHCDGQAVLTFIWYKIKVQP